MELSHALVGREDGNAIVEELVVRLLVGIGEARTVLNTPPIQSGVSATPLFAAPGNAFINHINLSVLGNHRPAQDFLHQPYQRGNKNRLRRNRARRRGVQ